MQPSLFPIDLKAALLQALKPGASNGKHERDLVRELDVKGRAIREAVNALRREGVAICGTPKTGYFIARTLEETEETWAFMNKRSMNWLETRRAFKRARAELAGQRRLKT
jgi:DNA-binding FadR family transcriptional regulator